MKVKIYTDGSARENPNGPGGYGVVLQYVDSGGRLHERELSAGYRKTTNNRMELMAAVAGLEALTRPCEVELYSDSRYLTDPFNLHWIEGWQARGWRKSDKSPVKNADLWKRLLEASRLHHVTYRWVKGHAGHPENERCDRLATTAADGDDLLEDRGWEDVPEQIPLTFGAEDCGAPQAMTDCGADAGSAAEPAPDHEPDWWELLEERDSDEEKAG